MTPAFWKTTGTKYLEIRDNKKSEEGEHYLQEHNLSKCSLEIQNKQFIITSRQWQNRDTLQ